MLARRYGANERTSRSCRSGEPGLPRGHAAKPDAISGPALLLLLFFLLGLLLGGELRFVCLRLLDLPLAHDRLLCAQRALLSRTAITVARRPEGITAGGSIAPGHGR